MIRGRDGRIAEQARSCALVAASLLVGAAAPDDGAVPPKSARAVEVRLGAGTIVLPIVMVREYPFVAGSVAGVRGKMMLDSGIEQALTINDHRVPAAGGRPIGTGHFGSGQSFAVRLVPALADIRIGPLRYPRATDVQVQDARMLEEITPDFIGWFGHDAWAGDHAMKLDYRRRRATFYRGGPRAYLRGERLAAALPFATRKLPNQPVMAGRAGTLPVVAAWDTGQYGTLYTGAANRERLVRQGVLTRSVSQPGRFDLHHLTLAGRAVGDVPGIEIEEGPFAAAAPIGIGEADILTIGYGFLRRYKTVWDYRARRLYLLAR